MQSLVLNLNITDEESVSEEKPTAKPKRKNLTSSKLRTADSSVLHKVVWPHEVVYNTIGQPALYANFPYCSLSKDTLP